MVDAATGAVVLAAGRGKRMASPLPKVLHRINGRSMLEHVLDTLTDLGFGRVALPPVVVVGFGEQQVRQAAASRATFAVQAELRGTGDAAATGLRALDVGVHRVLLIHGDEPLIEVATYREMLYRQEITQAPVVLLTGRVADTHALGRVIRDKSRRILSLTQEQELTTEQRECTEINFGAYVLDRTFMESTLPELETHAGGEYYLTDLVEIAVKRGLTVESVQAPYPDEQMGINDPGQLGRAELFLRRRES